VRGLGGFVRSSWDEVNEIIAAANVYTIKKHGPDRVIGFSPIPAMSMVSYAAGSRYLSLIGGVCMSFYDWYCDLPPSSPQVWGEQTDVPESADWYNSTFIIAWGSNVPQTRTPDAHFFTEVRYKGTKTVAVTPDYSEVAKLADIWMHPKQGTDAARGDGHGPRDPEGVLLRQAQRLLRRLRAPLHRHADAGDAQGAQLPGGETIWCPTAMCAPPTSTASSARPTTPSGRPSPSTHRQGGAAQRRRSASAGAGRPRRRGPVEPRSEGSASRRDVKLKLSVLEGEQAEHEVAKVGFPYFGGIVTSTSRTPATQTATCWCAPCRCAHRAGQGRRQREALVATVFDLQVANYGVARGLPANWRHQLRRRHALHPGLAGSASPACRARSDHRGPPVRRQRRQDHGKSMVIIGAAMNHWYHSDMNYRGVINMLMMCGCIGQSGGGWAHYVGQEKLRPQTGWTALAFALDWIRPPRQMNSTSFFYAHTDQWRYEKLGMDEVLSPLADKKYGGSMIDYNVRAERMGWLPSAPQLQTNPLQVVRDARKAGMDPEGLCGQGAEGRLAEDELHRPGPPGQLAAQHVRLALQPAGLSAARATSTSSSTCSAPATACRARTWARKAEAKPDRSGLARQGARRQARPAGDARLPHEHHLPVLRHRAADRHLVREERPQHQRHAPLHPPAVDRGRSGLAIAQRLGDLQGLREEVQRSLRRPPRRREGLVLTPLMHDTPGELAQVRRQGLEARRVRADPRQDGAADGRRRARLPERLQALHRARPADGQGRQRRQGHRLEHADRSGSSAS
jgi:nitrate reductase alpha subunit